MQTQLSFSKSFFHLLWLTSVAMTTFSFIHKGTAVTSAGFLTHRTQTDSLFVANNEIGWTAYAGSSYLKVETDSIVFEVVLSRQVPSGNNWSIPSEIGKIANSFIPVKGSSILYNEPNRKWNIIIQPDGKCFLKLLSGPVPLGNQIVMPIKIKYKKQ